MQDKRDPDLADINSVASVPVIPAEDITQKFYTERTV